MLRRDIDSVLAAGNTYHELILETGCEQGGSNRVAFPGMLVVKSERITPGTADDPDSLHLVEIADKRILVDQFSDTGALHFNLRSYASSDDFLNGTEGYTWSSAVSAIWSTMQGVLGAFPGLPADYTPHGIPENLHFRGVNAWRALSQVLRKIGCIVAYDPISDRFSVERLGSKPTGFSDALTSDGILLDAEALDSDAPRYPATIRVHFHDHQKSYGQERDTESIDNWVVSGVATFIDVPSGMAGSAPGTVLGLWDDLPRLHDEDQQETNAAELAARANQRAQNWIEEQATSGVRRHWVFPGIVSNVSPGSEVKAVLWRAWGPRGGGTATELVTHPGLPLRITGGQDAVDGVVWDHQSYSGENFAPPDLSRSSYPNYPRLPNAVQVWQSGGSVGDAVVPNPAGLLPGRLVRWVSGSLTTLEDVWILLLPLQSDSGVDDVTAHKGEYYIGRLSGCETYSDDTRPLYMVSKGAVAESTGEGSVVKVFWGKAKYNWSISNYVDVHPCDDHTGSGVDTSTTIRVQLPRAAEQHPNVIQDDVIAYVAATGKDGDYSEDEYVCVSDYLDEKILTVKMWAGNEADIQPGWAKMDGTDNGSPKGSGIDMVTEDGYFVRGNAPSNTVKGDNTHTHTGSTDSANTGITVLNHPDHKHLVATKGTTEDYASGSANPVEDVVADPCTSGMKLPTDCDDDEVYTHSVNDPGHSHDVNLSAGPNVPEHKTLWFIERINNSKEND